MSRARPAWPETSVFLPRKPTHRFFVSVKVVCGDLAGPRFSGRRGRLFNHSLFVKIAFINMSPCWTQGWAMLAQRKDSLVHLMSWSPSCRESLSLRAYIAAVFLKEELELPSPAHWPTAP